ncbi:hypothetical protein KID03_06180 [bacterium]|nr:hypothetical protein [bacterium]
MKITLLPQTAVTFGGKRNPDHNFENFCEFFNKNDGEKIMRQAISPELKAGEGFLSKVYSIPENDAFMLRVNKFEQNPLKTINLIKTKDYFPNLNLGQPIARLNPHAEILIKQEGLPCGIKHIDSNNCSNVFKEDVEPFIAYLKKAASFPQFAYDEFEKEIKIIHKNSHMFDFVNSQNVLFDEKAASFNIVDIIKRGWTKFNNCDLVMPMALLDFQNYSRINNFANNIQKAEIKDLSVQIIKKTNNAYYKNNKISPNLLLDFYANFIGIKNGRWITKEYFKMKKIIKTIFVNVAKTKNNLHF